MSTLNVLLPSIILAVAHIASRLPVALSLRTRTYDSQALCGKESPRALNTGPQTESYVHAITKGPQYPAGGRIAILPNPELKPVLVSF